MSRTAVTSLLCGAAALAGAPLTVGAQSTPRAVSLAAVVHPSATIERVSSPAERRAGDSTEFRVTLAVRSNTTFRVVARRTGAAGGPAITLGAGGASVRLAPNRNAVQVARGTPGVTVFTLAYAAADAGARRLAASDVWFDVVPDHERP